MAGELHVSAESIAMRRDRDLHIALRQRLHDTVMRTAEEHDAPLTLRHVDLMVDAVIDELARPPSYAYGVQLSTRKRRASAKLLASPVSQRELDVIACAAAGLIESEVAEYLGITVNSVKTHYRRALHRLDARNRAHLIAVAIRAGLLDDHPYPPRATEPPRGVPGRPSGKRVLEPKPITRPATLTTETKTETKTKTETETETEMET